MSSEENESNAAHDEDVHCLDAPSTSVEQPQVIKAEHEEDESSGDAEISPLDLPPVTVLLHFIYEQKKTILGYQEKLNILDTKFTSLVKNFRTSHEKDQNYVESQLNLSASYLRDYVQLVTKKIGEHRTQFQQQILEYNRRMDQMLVREAQLERACEKKDKEITEQRTMMQKMGMFNKNSGTGDAQSVPCLDCIAHVATIEQMRLQHDEVNKTVEELQSSEAQNIAQINDMQTELDNMTRALKRSNFQRDAWMSNVKNLEEEVVQLKKSAEEEARRHAMQLEEISAKPACVPSLVEPLSNQVTTTAPSSDTGSDNLASSTDVIQNQVVENSNISEEDKKKDNKSQKQPEIPHHSKNNKFKHQKSYRKKSRPYGLNRTPQRTPQRTYAAVQESYNRSALVQGSYEQPAVHNDWNEPMSRMQEPSTWTSSESWVNSSNSAPIGWGGSRERGRADSSSFNLPYAQTAHDTWQRSTPGPSRESFMYAAPQEQNHRTSESWRQSGESYSFEAFPGSGSGNSGRPPINGPYASLRGRGGGGRW